MKTLLLALVIATALSPARGWAQGSLTPPGPPGPTMKSLQEIWDRIGGLETANQQLTQQLVAQNQVLHALAGAQGLLGWSFTTVDSVDDGVNLGADLALAIAPNGHPALGYFDADTNQLKYATFNGSAWATSTVPGVSNVGGHLSLAFTPGGQPAVCYYDAVLANLHYAVFNGSTWTIETVDSAGDVGQHGSLAFAPNGNPAIAYYDVTNANLKYAIRGTSVWARVTVDSAGSVGRNPSLAFGPNGQPSIAYHDATNQQAKYAAFDAVWTTQAVGDGGDDPALVFTSSGLPAIAFKFVTDIKYAAFNGSNWYAATTFATGHDTYAFSMRLSPGGKPAVAWVEAKDPIGAGTEILRYAELNGETWVVTTVVQDDTSLFADSSLAFPAHGQPVIAFQQDGDLKVATRRFFPAP